MEPHATQTDEPEQPMSTSHLDRKELKRPDAFLERINALFRYIGENSKAFLALLVLLVLLASGTALLSSLSDKKSDEANSALYLAHQTLSEGLAKTTSAVKPEATDEETGKPVEAAKKPEAPKMDWEPATRPGLEQIEKVTKDFSGTEAAFEGLSLLGDT